jgi:hypothetical protein
MRERCLRLRPGSSASAEARLRFVLAKAVARLLDWEDASPTSAEERPAAARNQIIEETAKALTTLEGVEILSSPQALRETLSHQIRVWFGPGQISRIHEAAAALAPEVISELASSGAVRLEPTRGTALVAQLARDLRLAVTVFLAVGRTPLETLASSPQARTPLVGFMFESTAHTLRESPEALTILFGDAQLRGLVCQTVERHLATALAQLRRDPPAAKPPGPPFGGGPAGGLPAEVRAWEVRPGETAPEPDPEKRERPGPVKTPRNRPN